MLRPRSTRLLHGLLFLTTARTSKKEHYFLSFQVPQIYKRKLSLALYPCSCHLIPPVIHSYFIRLMDPDTNKDSWSCIDEQVKWEKPWHELTDIPGGLRGTHILGFWIFPSRNLRWMLLSMEWSWASQRRCWLYFFAFSWPMQNRFTRYGIKFAATPCESLFKRLICCKSKEIQIHSIRVKKIKPIASMV
jgi:hypothetical protein